MGKFDTLLKAIKHVSNIHIYLADYLGAIKKTYVLSLKNGIKYYVRGGTCDRGIVNEVCLRNSYTPKQFVIGNDDVVVDIGAQIGVFSIYAAKFATGGRVFSFEPTPENFQMLLENVKLNQLSNITPISMAVSDKTGKEQIFICNNNTGGHSILKSKSSSESIVVKSTSLDDFILQYGIKHIDFLKLDCEGAEYKILFKCSKSTLGMIKKISMEYHDINDRQNVDAMKVFLESNGEAVAQVRRGIDIDVRGKCIF